MPKVVRHTLDGYKASDRKTILQSVHKLCGYGAEISIQTIKLWNGSDESQRKRRPGGSQACLQERWKDTKGTTPVANVAIKSATASRRTRS